MINGIVEDQLLLELKLADGDTTKFPQVIVYTDAGATEATVNLSHVANGIYQGTYTPNNEGHFSASYIVYNDGAHTQVANKYDRVGEHIRILPPDGRIS